MAAIAYVRVSTDRQADSGAGLAAQRDAIAAFAKRNGLTVTATFEDAGVSGAAGLEDRPGLIDALAALRRGDVLIVAKRDRLARDVMVSAVVEKQIGRRGASIMSADGCGNGDTAADAFMRTVMDGAAQFERSLIAARTKAAMHSKKKAGERVGEVPFGYDLTADGRLVENAAEQNVIALIIECRAAGVSLRRIAAILTQAGHVTKKGGAWVHTSVKSIIDRHDSLAA